MDKIEYHIRRLMRPPKRIRRSFGKLWSIIGFAFILGACYLEKNRIDLVIFGQRTDGVIVAAKPINNRIFIPVIQFVWEAREIRFEDNFGSPSEPAIGTSVPILVDPKKPYIAMVDRGYYNLFPWGPFLVMGVILMGSGLRQSGKSSMRRSQ